MPAQPCQETSSIFPRRPCSAEISLSALEHNFRLLADRAPGELLAVVKADAYGHSLVLCAPPLVTAGARWLGVTSVEEGIVARSQFSTLPCAAGLSPDPEILVMSGIFPGQAPALVAHRLTPAVWEPWQLIELAAAAEAAGLPSLPVHLEIDTGMSRQGVAPEHLAAILGHFAPPSRLRLAAVMTHLYAADEADHLSTADQLGRLAQALAQVLDQLSDLGPETPGPQILSVGNSAALLDDASSAQLRALADRFGLRLLIRPGLALYGLAPRFSPDTPVAVAALGRQLRPVLSWKTRIVSIRTVAPGETVGYNGTFVATEAMRIALLAVGYADGLRRELSNSGSVLIDGQRLPIIGRISMDQTTIDVTDLPNAAPGDEVTLIGSQGEANISAEDHARFAGTIPWEILTGISARVPRVPA